MANDGPCLVDGCTTKAWAREMCPTHYSRWLKHGDPLVLLTWKSVEERFWSKVDRRGPDECWPWMAGRVPKGYGRFAIDGIPRVASRVAYELTHGKVSDDLYVLHRCDNPPCCNPAHLWLGTKAQNNADMVAKGRYKATYVPVTHCYRGHPYDEENTYWLRGRRSCRACRRVNAHLRKAQAS